MANLKSFEKLLSNKNKNKNKNNNNKIKYSNTQLDLNELERLRNIFNSTVINKKNDKQNITQITKKFNKKNILLPDEEYIRNLAMEYLDCVGLHVNKNNFMIEYWRYRCFNDKLSSALPHHKDSYGQLLCPINTCIFYIRKDKTLNGGNLNIYSRIGIKCLKPHRTIISSNNNVVLLDGDLYHQITSFTGTGIRDIIVVQFEKEFELKPIFCNMIKIKSYKEYKNM